MIQILKEMLEKIKEITAPEDLAEINKKIEWLEKKAEELDERTKSS